MRKTIKLNKKPEAPPPKESRFFFVKDQGTGAVRVVIIIFKLIELFLTTVYALCLGIFAPLSLWLGADASDEVNFFLPALLWLIASVLYIAGLFTLIFGKEKPAAIIHGAAGALTLATYAAFCSALAEFGGNGPAGLYMPCLLITALTVAILLMLNIPVWFKRCIEKRDEKAPSILGDDVDNDKEPKL